MNMQQMEQEIQAGFDAMTRLALDRGLGMNFQSFCGLYPARIIHQTSLREW
jgi:hypothetical protein